MTDFLIKTSTTTNTQANISCTAGGGRMSSKEKKNGVTSSFWRNNWKRSFGNCPTVRLIKGVRPRVHVHVIQI